MWYMLLAMTYLCPISQIVLGRQFAKKDRERDKAEAAEAAQNGRPPEENETAARARKARRILAKGWMIGGSAALVISTVVMLFFYRAELQTAGFAAISLIILQCLGFVWPYIPIYRMLNR